MKLAACVVLYNPDNDVFENILTYGNFVDNLIVVDNSLIKNDCLIDKLKSSFETKLIYINNNDNLGIATALNQACDKAIELQFKWILTMDQDSSFENFDHYLKCFYSVHYNEDIAILAGNTEGNKSNNINLTMDYEEKFIVITSANIINLKYFEQIGRFDDKLFIDAVDFDFCIKANINKLKILLFKDVYVNHALGEVFLRRNIFTKKERYKVEHNAQRAYYITRNYMYIATKYHTLYPKEMGLLHNINILFIHEVTKILIYEDDKFNKLKGKFIGLYHFLIGRYGKYNLKK
ncbi:glycosyltransferase family protein [Aliarcobacter butzleri]|uniref:glycosyltransferase n=1 Tax=Aliarcobacter butzleri TaxID=28197 RepID=UPI001260FE5A|nr:glycosyltransferase [Aliarcobacter butzleri]